MNNSNDIRPARIAIRSDYQSEFNEPFLHVWPIVVVTMCIAPFMKQAIW